MIRIKEYEKVALAGGGDVPPPEDPNNRESRKKLDRPNTSSNEGAPSKGQRQLERGHETER